MYRRVVAINVPCNNDDVYNPVARRSDVAMSRKFCDLSYLPSRKLVELERADVLTVRDLIVVFVCVI